MPDTPESTGLHELLEPFLASEGLLEASHGDAKARAHVCVSESGRVHGDEPLLLVEAEQSVVEP